MAVRRLLATKLGKVESRVLWITVHGSVTNLVPHEDTRRVALGD